MQGSDQYLTLNEETIDSSGYSAEGGTLTAASAVPHHEWSGSVQFSSVQSLDRLGRRGDMMDDSAEILLQFFFLLQEALVNSSGTGRDVHSLMLSIQHFLCRPRSGEVGTEKKRREKAMRCFSATMCPLSERRDESSFPGASLH